MRRFLAYALAAILCGSGAVAQVTTTFAGVSGAAYTSPYIKSIQQVSIPMASVASNTATISSVDTTKSILILQGSICSSGSSSGFTLCTPRMDLTNATTVTAHNGGAGATLTANAVVVEFKTGVNSIQAGTIALGSGVTSNTASISATSGCAVPIFQGAESSTASLGFGALSTSIDLSGTTVTARVGFNSATSLTVGYMIADLDSTLCNSVASYALTDATANTSYTQAITSVTAANAIILWNGQTFAATSQSNMINAAHELVLTNGTTVTATRSGTVATSRTIRFTVLEFKSAALNSSVQRATIDTTGSASKTATITAVSTSRAFANYSGVFGGGTSPGQQLLAVALTNATTVTATVFNNGGTTPTLSFDVVEFK